MNKKLVSLAAIIVLALGMAPLTSVAAQDDSRGRLDSALDISYFLSVDNFAGPTMMGGMGVPFQPPMEAMMAMAEKAQFDLSKMPKNPGLVRAIYASGVPALAPGVEPDPNDFGTLRWDPSTFDKTITPATQAMMSMKYVEWAKFFHHAYESEGVLFPTPMERFLALAFVTEGKVLSNFAAENLMSENGYVHAITFEEDSATIEDDAIDAFDQVLMLWSLSDLAYVLESDEYPNLNDPERVEMIRNLADKSFLFVNQNKPTEHKGLAIVSLLWYSVVTQNDSQREEAIALIKDLANSLGSGETTAFDKAESIRGLIEAWRITGNEQYLTTADRLFQELDGLWDESAHAYATTSTATTYTYTPFDVGLIVGALSEVHNFLGAATASPSTTELAEERYLDFFEEFILKSGFVHTPVPTPSRSGLFVTEISYEKASGEWTVTDPRYTSLGSLYLANELIWFEGTIRQKLNGYPDVSEALNNRVEFAKSAQSVSVDTTPPTTQTTGTVNPNFLPVLGLIVGILALIAGLGGYVAGAKRRKASA